MTDYEAEAITLYQEAMQRRKEIIVLWEKSGRPLLAVGSQGQEIEHPLVRMLRNHDLLIQKLAVDIKKAHSGPQPSAVIKPSPAAQIRELRQVGKPARP
jgi:hypothetical protein